MLIEVKLLFFHPPNKYLTHKRYYWSYYIVLHLILKY